MTFRADKAEPCWQVNDVATGQPHDFYEEGWPHHPTRYEAEEQMAEDIERIEDNREPDDPWAMPKFVVAQSFPTPCVHLVCDGCGEEWESDSGSTHLDPRDPMADYDLVDYDWATDGRRHWHNDCALLVPVPSR